MFCRSSCSSASSYARRMPRLRSRRIAPLCLASTTTTTTASPSLAYFSAMTEARRHQRSTSTRIRNSGWREKTEQHERIRKEQQEEALRAAQRRARYSSSASTRQNETGTIGDLRTHHSNAAASSSEATTAVADQTAPSGGTALPTRPPSGFLNFLKGGEKGRKSQPVNPLHFLNSWRGRSKYEQDIRSTQRLLDAIAGLQQKNKRRRDPITVQLSDEQKREMVNSYAGQRWYWWVYYPCRNVTDRQLKWWARWSKLGLAVLVCACYGLLLYLYYCEMDVFVALSPEDQRDYIYFVLNMRYSDFYKAGKAVLDRDDPLVALPPAVRCHMAIEACREKGWDKVDWGVENRRLHPHSALEEGDYIHLLFWAMMYLGSAISGGGVIFSDRVMDVSESYRGAKEREEERDRFVEAEPTALPVSMKKSFF